MPGFLERRGAGGESGGAQMPGFFLHPQNPPLSVAGWSAEASELLPGIEIGPLQGTHHLWLLLSGGFGLLGPSPPQRTQVSGPQLLCFQPPAPPFTLTSARPTSREKTERQGCLWGGE